MIMCESIVFDHDSQNLNEIDMASDSNSVSDIDWQMVAL